MRIGKKLPWIGGAIALATIVGTMRRKGVCRGAVDTCLNAVPFLGTAKSVVETIRGRDFIPDRPRVRGGML